MGGHEQSGRLHHLRSSSCLNHFWCNLKPLNLYGAFLFFEDSARARSECDLLNARSFSDIHYSVEPALNLTAPLSPYANPLTVAWRRVLLAARCFTRTLSLGWHHLTSVSRDDLNASQDVVRRSTSASNFARVPRHQERQMPPRRNAGHRCQGERSAP